MRDFIRRYPELVGAVVAMVVGSAVYDLYRLGLHVGGIRAAVALQAEAANEALGG